MINKQIVTVWYKTELTPFKCTGDTAALHYTIDSISAGDMMLYTKYTK